MDASTADRPVTLTGLVLHILSFLERPTMFQLTLVCRHFSTFVQPHGLNCAWNTIRRWEMQEDVLELPQLDSLPRVRFLRRMFSRIQVVQPQNAATVEHRRQFSESTTSI